MNPPKLLVVILKIKRILFMEGKVTPTLALAGLLILWWAHSTFAGNSEVLRPRVHPDQMNAARALENPLPATPELIGKGKALFQGKGFCVTCHGPDGKGLGNIPGLTGKLPRNFTDKTWQATRTDGELYWILQNGSPGTDMAPFIPLILSPEEAWQVVLYVRWFGQ